MRVVPKPIGQKFRPQWKKTHLEICTECRRTAVEARDPTPFVVPVFVFPQHIAPLHPQTQKALNLRCFCCSFPSPSVSQLDPELAKSPHTSITPMSVSSSLHHCHLPSHAPNTPPPPTPRLAPWWAGPTCQSNRPRCPATPARSGPDPENAEATWAESSSVAWRSEM